MTGYEIERSGQYIIVRFEKAPPESVRERLKAVKMKYAAYQREWIGKTDEETVRGILRDAERREEMTRRFSAKSTTICWNCGRASSPSCPWQSEGVPVEGWEALPTVLDTYYTSHGVHGRRKVESYVVSECPLFTKKAEKPGQEFAGYAQGLAMAVILQAVRDWESVSVGVEIAGCNQETLRAFFRSRWCGFLLVNSDIDQEALCDKLGVTK